MQRKLKKAIRVATALLTVYYAYILEYRAEIFFWVLSNGLPFIFMGVWIQAASSAEFGVSPLEFAHYFIAAFIVRQFNIVWVIWDFEKEVVEGRLSPYLLQPIDPVWHQVAAHIAERFVRVPFLVVFMAFVFLLYPDGFWLPSLTNLLLAILAVAIAFALRFIMQYTFAMAAFWTERAIAIEQLSLLGYLFLSGLIAPLTVFPDAVREVVMWTPYPYMIFFPAALLIGLPIDFGRGVITMLVWGIIFFILNRYLWRRGLKKYSGMGA